jgi:hypothetical protein
MTRKHTHKTPTHSKVPVVLKLKLTGGSGSGFAKSFSGTGGNGFCSAGRGWPRVDDGVGSLDFFGGTGGACAFLGVCRFRRVFVPVVTGDIVG